MKKSRKFILNGSLLVAGALITMSSALQAILMPPPQPDEELLPLFYETLGGDQWHNNGGWLDPDVHWCNWYGISCAASNGDTFYLTGIELPDNNLSGELTEELAQLLFVEVVPESRLDLSANAITGELSRYPRLIRVVDLSGNALSGPLPPLEGEWVLEDNQRLFLNRNAFSGSIPESWSQARLWMLDLSDNALTSGHMHAIDAISPPGDGFVYFKGNPLEGELTDTVLSAPLSERDGLGAYGGIDICFTRLTVEDQDVRDWLADHHVASADFDQCLNRDRTDVDATLSGSWYNPGRPGEGVSVMMLDNGAPLLYSFSFDLEGNQQWAFEVGVNGEHWTAWDALKETRGSFNEGIRREDDYTFIRRIANYRFDRVDNDTVNLYRRYTDARGCGPWGAPSESQGPSLCPIDFVVDRLDYQRLTELAGTTCENQNEVQQYSGAWYNPERSGEGLVVEVLPDGRAVIYWFTYRPGDSDRQVWMIAEGVVETEFDVILVPPIPKARVLWAPTLQPVGGAYGSEFDPQDIELIDWGTISLHFYGPDSARLNWDSNDPTYGSGNYELERLAQPMLAECDSGQIR